MNNKLMDCERTNSNLELNSEMMSLLATDMHDVLSKYILECLMWKVTSLPGVSKKEPGNVLAMAQSSLSLKQLALNK